MHQTKTVFLLSCLVVFSVFLLGCTTPKTSETNQPIKIGVLADLSGDYAHFMRGIPNGVSLAVEDLQKETSRPIQLIVEDQKSCDAKETATIMQKFVNIDNIDLVIGGTCSSSTLIAAPIANTGKTVIISPASSSPNITTAGEYVFRTYISDALRSKVAAQTAFDLKKQKMAIILDNSNDAFAQGAINTKAAFEQLGGFIVAEESVSSNSETDFRSQLEKIKNAEPDVLLISMGPKQLALVAKQAKEFGLILQLIVPIESAEDVEVVQIAGGAVEGLLYVMPGNPPQTPAYQELKKRYTEKFGEEELPPYTAESYDAAMLGVKAVLASNGTKEDIKNKLFTVSKTYYGVSGNVRFDQNGDVNKTSLIKVIRNGQFVEYVG